MLGSTLLRIQTSRDVSLHQWPRLMTVVIVCLSIESYHCTTAGTNNEGLTEVPTYITTGVTSSDLSNNYICSITWLSVSFSCWPWNSTTIWSALKKHRRESAYFAWQSAADLYYFAWQSAADLYYFAWQSAADLYYFAWQSAADLYYFAWQSACGRTRFIFHNGNAYIPWLGW